MLIAGAFSALLVAVAQAAPLHQRDDQNSIVDSFEILSLLTGASATYKDGTYSLYSADISNQEGIHNSTTRKSQFSSTDGKLTMLDGTGALVGYVYPKESSFMFQLDSGWATNPYKNPMPDFEATSPSNYERKRDLSGFYYARKQQLKKKASRTSAPTPTTTPKLMSQKLTRTESKEIQQTESRLDRVVGALKKWLLPKVLDKRDDSDFREDVQIFMPVFVRGLGVTIKAFLGLDQVIFQGDSFGSASSGELFVDMDEIFEFKNCQLCNHPISKFD